MLNRSASLAMSTSVLKALPGKLDIKRHSSSILYVMADFQSAPYNPFVTRHPVQNCRFTFTSLARGHWFTGTLVLFNLLKQAIACSIMEVCEGAHIL